jgi:hypothetical protein
MIEFKTVSGLEAREIDPARLDWPADSKVIFAMRGGKVIGRTAKIVLPAMVIPFDMIEGTWIDEAERGSTLAVRLIKQIEQLFRDDGKTHAFAFSYDDHPEVGEYLFRFGYKHVPFTVWQKQLVGSEVA